MPIIATALVAFLFLPGGSIAPVAEAKTSAPIAQSSGEEPSPAPVPASKPEVVTKPLTVKLTAYNAVPEQTDGDPSVTASGLASNPEVMAARSHDLAKELPFGTVIALYRDGKDSPSCNFNKVSHLIGYRVIGDTMDTRWVKRIDVQFDEADKVKVGGVRMNPSLALGVCSGVSVKVVGRLSLKHIPDTQEELAKLFDPEVVALNS